MNNSNQYYCRFCSWSYSKGYVNKKGEKVDNFIKLVDHVSDYHPEREHLITSETEELLEGRV